MEQAVKHNTADIPKDLYDNELVPGNDAVAVPVSRQTSPSENSDDVASSGETLATEPAEDLEDGRRGDKRASLKSQTDEQRAGAASSDFPNIPETSRISDRFDVEASLRTDIAEFDRTELLHTTHRFKVLGEEISNSSRTFLSLAREADNLVNYFQLVQNDLSLLEQTTNELRHLKEHSDRIEKRLHKALEDERRAAEVRQKLANVEHENSSLLKKLERLEVDFQRSAQDLALANNKLVDRDRKIIQLSSKVSSLTEQHVQSQDKLADISGKYNEFNKRSLEQKNEHYQKVQELEAALREVRRELQASKQEKSELAAELNATNNLLSLQEEMIAEIPNKNARTA